MEIRFVSWQNRYGFRLNGSSPLFSGAHLAGPVASALGWTGKTKGLSERFLLLLVLLAAARKLSEEVQHQFSISVDEFGYISLQDLRRFTPFCGTASCDIMKRDICNHFCITPGEGASFISIQPATRGSHADDRIRITCPPEALHFECATGAIEWIRQFAKPVEQSGTAPSSNSPTNTRLPPSWQTGFEGLVGDFCPRRPIAHPQQFFGRRLEIQKILGWLSRMPLQNPVIFGSRISGKTSLLRQICHINAGTAVRAEHQYTVPLLQRLQVAFVDFEIPQMQRLPKLLDHILICLGITTPRLSGVDHFMELIVSHIQSPTVIIMDNIGTALRESTLRGQDETLPNSLWDNMRALGSSYTHGNLAFVGSTRETPEKLAERYQYSSSFLNIFRPLELGQIDHEAACALLDSGAVPFPEEDRAWILEICSGWPGLLQIASDHCLESLRNPGEYRNWRSAAEREMERLRRKSAQES